MAKWLTKSDYTNYLVHPALLWLRKHDKDKLPGIDEVTQARFDSGAEVEEYARQLFPGGILVEAEIFDMADKTKAEIAAATASPRNDSGPLTIFQAAVLTDRRLYAAADVMVQSPSTGSGSIKAWDLYEVKSSTKVHGGQLDDLAFQYTAFTEGGYKLNKLHIVHINAGYSKDGEIDPKKLFKIEDVTDQVMPLLAKTAERIEAAIAVIASPECPDMDPKHATHLKRWLEVYNGIHGVPEPDSVYNLTRLNMQQFIKLDAAGITKISQIPVRFPLKPQQKIQVEVVKLGRRAIDKLKIQRELDSLKFPLYFLDYETVGPAVPLYDSSRPFQPVPFQYSLDIIPSPGAELTHKEYLARGADDPVPGLMHQLQQDIGSVGSVLVWFKPFEMGVNESMAHRHPEFADFLLNVNERVHDLMEIFSLNMYADPGFFGSSSIKKVLPVLIPEMSYKDLGIGEGMTASLRWYKAARGQTTPQEAEQVYADLLEYCGQDTMAMVRIYQFLLGVVATKEPV